MPCLACRSALVGRELIWHGISPDPDPPSSQYVKSVCFFPPFLFRVAQALPSLPSLRCRIYSRCAGCRARAACLLPAPLRLPTRPPRWRLPATRRPAPAAAAVAGWRSTRSRCPPAACVGPRRPGQRTGPRQPARTTFATPASACSACSTAPAPSAPSATSPWPSSPWFASDDCSA